MKVIIDPYRGGKDTGENYSNQYEKNILLDTWQLTLLKKILIPN